MLAINTNLLPQLSRPRILPAKTSWAGCLIFSLILGFVGCTSPSSTSTGPPASGTRSTTAPPTRVHAQGQIMPAQGFIKLYTTPGDVVTELPVKIGSKVKRGDVLARMRSEKSLQSQQTTLLEQKRSAVREWENAIKQAQLKLSAAEMKVQQVDSQQESLKKQSALIVDAERQVASTERIFERLSAIATDNLTREFVGQLELDRQSLTVGEARGKVAQQRNTRDQAAKDLELAAKAASAEVTAAQTMLSMAQEADPASAFDSQIAALQAEAARAVLLAPTDGVVLAVHTAVGGSVVQTPLIELANVDSVVCELEVNVAQARWIEAGQKVRIKSDSLPEELTGVVQEKSQVVGKPRLRSLDPLAAVDYRTLSVIVALDKPELAGQWLQLQVEAQIDLSNASHP